MELELGRKVEVLEFFFLWGRGRTHKHKLHTEADLIMSPFDSAIWGLFRRAAEHINLLRTKSMLSEKGLPKRGVMLVALNWLPAMYTILW